MAKTIKTKNYVYTGSIKDGKPHGKGIMEGDTDPSTSIKHIQTKVDICINGYFKVTSNQLDQFGSFKKKVFINGKGESFLKNLNIWPRLYEGNFINGYKHGWGKETFPYGTVDGNDEARRYIKGLEPFPSLDDLWCNGPIEYEGYFKKGKPNGKGTLTTYYVEPDYIDGKHAAIKFFVFKGNFINGRLNGYGEYEFLGSDYYPTPEEAEWAYRKYGKQTYKGEFKDNKLHGKGALKQFSKFRGRRISPAPYERTSIGEFKDNKFYSGKMIIAKQEGYPKEKIVKFSKFKIVRG